MALEEDDVSKNIGVKTPAKSVSDSNSDATVGDFFSSGFSLRKTLLKRLVDTGCHYVRGPSRLKSEISERKMTSYTICGGGGCFDWIDGVMEMRVDSLIHSLTPWTDDDIFKYSPENLDNLGSSITSWPTDRDACSQGGVGICSETSCIAQKMDPSATTSISAACSQSTFALLNQRWYPFQ